MAQREHLVLRLDKACTLLLLEVHKLGLSGSLTFERKLVVTRHEALADLDGKIKSVRNSASKTSELVYSPNWRALVRNR